MESASIHTGRRHGQWSLLLHHESSATSEDAEEYLCDTNHASQLPCDFVLLLRAPRAPNQLHAHIRVSIYKLWFFTCATGGWHPILMLTLAGLVELWPCVPLLAVRNMFVRSMSGLD